MYAKNNQSGANMNWMIDTFFKKFKTKHKLVKRSLKPKMQEGNCKKVRGLEIRERKA